MEAIPLKISIKAMKLQVKVQIAKRRKLPKKMRPAEQENSPKLKALKSISRRKTRIDFNNIQKT